MGRNINGSIHILIAISQSFIHSSAVVKNQEPVIMQNWEFNSVTWDKLLNCFVPQLSLLENGDYKCI